MAATPAAAQLTEAHRLAQLRLAASTIALLANIWPLLDTKNLDGTFDRWLSTVRPIVNAQRLISSRVAIGYVTAFRSLELGVTNDRAFRPQLAGPVVDEALATSMLLTGPARLRAALARGVSYTSAVSRAQASSSAAAMRHVLNGGRDTIDHTIEADDKALGWARVASGKACHFCAMLAGRGPIYKNQTAGFDAHDHCTCSAEPVYRDDAAWPAGSTGYHDLWEESTRGLSGDDALNAFRQSLAGR